MMMRMMSIIFVTIRRHCHIIIDTFYFNLTFKMLFHGTCPEGRTISIQISIIQHTLFGVDIMYTYNTKISPQKNVESWEREVGGGEVRIKKKKKKKNLRESLKTCLERDV
jgi:hypothetical protein